MTTHLAATVSQEWLSLREPADHAARSRELVSEVLRVLPGGGVTIHDLGSGTGSMPRWLAPQLPRPQRWELHDRDADLLARAVAIGPPEAADGSPILLTTRHGDVTTIRAADLAGADLVTTSALLDLLTADEVTRIALACVNASCPALFTLSVTGEVVLTPAHWLDKAIGAAFDAHQRRTVAGRQLLGPDAVDHATDAFGRLGAQVTTRESPWRLGADDIGLVVEWITGWVGAACEQRPELVGPARDYLRQRLSEAATGRLGVTVGHADLLAVAPPESGRTARAGRTCSGQKGASGR